MDGRRRDGADTRAAFHRWTIPAAGKRRGRQDDECKSGCSGGHERKTENRRVSAGIVSRNGSPCQEIQRPLISPSRFRGGGGRVASSLGSGGRLFRLRQRVGDGVVNLLQPDEFQPVT